MLKNFEPLIKLPVEEEKKFGDFIRNKRNSLISTPKDTVTKVINSPNNVYIQLLKEWKISDAIFSLRESSYEAFLTEESLFNAEILKEIANKFDTPKSMLENISNKLRILTSLSQQDFYNELNDCFGKYAGYISPYIYQLCLSNTQSRRSRAGAVFESIIYSLYDYFHYPYESQASIGKKAFSELRLGKIVDSILPSVNCFKELRNKTIVGTMKTTLRERWQEVVEEIQRSNLPNIYLLTVDDDISENKVIQMREHNIVLVVLNETKQKSHLKEMRNVIDFETYFKVEIPNILNYWS